MIHITDNAEKLSFWQLVFLQSKVNGVPYHEEELSQHKWNWPRDTYLQRRLRYLRGEVDIPPLACLNRSAKARFEVFYQKLLEQF